MKQVDKQKALSSLRYAGWLGHEFVGLREDYGIKVQANSLESAQKSMNGENGSIWQQTKSSVWKQVT